MGFLWCNAPGIQMEDALYIVRSVSEVSRDNIVKYEKDQNKWQK